MKSLLLIADTNTQLNQLRELLGPVYTLFTAASPDEALDYLRLTKVDVVLTACEDRTLPLAELFEQAKAIQPHCVTCYVTPPLSSDLQGSENDLPQSDFLLRRPFDGTGLRLTLEQALEKQRLLEEIGALREQETSPQPPVPPVNGGELSLSRIGQILRNFTKAFGTNFDLQRTLNLFVEAISEFLRPSRLSIMVRHSSTRVFEIRAHRGLAPKVAEQLHLREDEGLPQWLMTEARIVHRSEVESRLRTPAYLEIHREMQALKAVVSIPLMASGTLVGILNLGERATGVPYTEDELEILFSLADHVAVGIQDISLYHTVQAQQIFTEKILRYMKSGVITISMDEKISLCNHRAAEILGATWLDVLHKDLRSLPSPLGDLLYETLRDGVSYHHHEVTLAAGRIPLELSTYRIFDEQGEISGSVMVFDDLSFQKQLSEERRRGDQLDFLNKVVGRMAHEIKNPLVSIQTFVELLDEQYDDPEFRAYFRDIVSRDVRTVDSITEKLVSFASKISYRFTNDDINKALHHLVEALVPEPMTVITSGHFHNGSEVTYEAPPACVELISTELLPPVKFDPEQFHKALMYLALFLRQDIDGSGKIRVSSQLGHHTLQSYSGDWVHITLTGQGRKLSPEELHQLFDPFCMEQSTLVDVGPCVSQKIIEEHGGHLDVCQETNGDITFMIVLPITQQAAEGNER